MGNAEWFQEFKDSFVNYNYMNAGMSENFPLLVHLKSHMKSGPKPLRYFQFWAEHPDFLNVVKRAWNSKVVEGNRRITVFRQSDLEWVIQIMIRSSWCFYDN